MSFTPPPLPDNKTLARVLRIAGFDGKSVFVIASGCALLSAMFGDRLGAVIGVLAAVAGWAELRGVKLLKAGKADGVNWLVRAQLLLLTVILVYVGLRLRALAVGGVNAVTSEFFRMMAESAERWGPADQRAYAENFKLFYGIIALITLLFQGGLALYYHRSRAAVVGALALLPANNPLLAACPVCRQTVSRAAPMCPHCGHPLVPTVGV